jgi:FtsP/CotA-like multicopper oxidase with cupredoxin domain
VEELVDSRLRISRRSLLMAGGGALAGLALRPLRLDAAPAPSALSLVAAPARARILGDSSPDTAVWSYNGRLPGPEIRVRQGAPVRISLDNGLPQDTTIHWHGVRVPNAMDGAPAVTQPPIPPGGNFTYDFTPPDAGTYWYHPHAHSAEQIGRGLMGAFIVEEPTPLPVDREVVWLLGDWRLEPDASIASGFDNRMEGSMAGRVGNAVTINGRVPDRFSVRAGERLRLRLINAAPARIFGLEFRDHRPLVVALDGQPIEPHAPDGGRVVLGPAMRADLVLDMTGAPGSRSPIVDSFYEDLSYKLVDLAYAEKPLRKTQLAPPAKLPPNAVPEPDLARAQRHDVTLTGGMMGGMGGGMIGGGMMGGMGMGGGMSGMMGGNAMWAINGVAAGPDMNMKPILTLDRGKSYILAIENRTAWYHPIHLHGHSFRVITRNGRPTRYREWRDTVLIAPRERAEIAFVADNPGDWMFHCHILDHQEGGMMSVIRVA